MTGYGYDYGWGSRRGFSRESAHPGWDDAPGWNFANRESVEADLRGWSRPEFNVSLGASRAANWRPDWRAETGSRFARAGRAIESDRSWRTGEPWGSGYTDADRLRVRDLMTENPEVVTPDATLTAVAARMRDLDVGIIPVVDHPDRNLLQGVITDRDIVVRAAAEGKNLARSHVREFMSTEVASVGESATVREVFSVMKRDQIRRVPVTDASGRLLGIVALADLAVDYAGLNLDRELEVEEVIERISEPPRPRRFGKEWIRSGAARPDRYDNRGSGYDRQLREKVIDRWRSLKHGARHLLDRDHDRYDHGFQREGRFYDRDWR